MESGIYNINKRFHHCTPLLIRHLSDAAEFIGFIHQGKQKRFLSRSDDRVITN
ncbi:hypothetical protein [Candidatus Enterovibrio escicola]|uniref:Uncharacterized protein n=1 Tax=Candidatus Enterovibrio escicola TaxID=1927127 RepID=A0A2A5T618_9GAMM|nr:hypothetical protein [Candidatus Enterovibrio escacola]PCS23568.1 hypothetical protein BTN49_0537 [Candidatus Enterovibrio escacola]